MNVLRARIENGNRTAFERVEVAAERTLTRPAGGRRKEGDLAIVFNKLALVEFGYGLGCFNGTRILVITNENRDRLVVAAYDGLREKR